ncbi:MAG: hypothetical protein JRG96_18865 [Deltaproteobacteria bacterium]|nr:hypothetical protein [Deltaproteobacteria bacterium]MBW2420071.1 hypothetical protein [Deltaproteobacteria bacterium]
MNTRTLLSLLALVVLCVAGSASAYPGGTPDFQTDVEPFCAACHSSTDEAALAGAGERARKEVAARKHIAPIQAGEKGYGKLSEADRATLIAHIQAVDANSKITLEFPPQVAAGENFQVTVKLTGGAGPVVGVALVDRPHRWFARSATSAGWTVVDAPTVIGPDGSLQTQWLGRRPERYGRNITYVNVTGVSSDAAAGTWSKSKVIFTLRAPDKPGDYPLVGTYLYGTEKASPLGYEEHPIYGKLVRGTYQGKSGRVKFTPLHVITVK